MLAGLQCGFLFAMYHEFYVHVQAMLESELQQKLEEISPPFAARCKKRCDFLVRENYDPVYTCTVW